MNPSFDRGRAVAGDPVTPGHGYFWFGPTEEPGREAGSRAQSERGMMEA